MDDIHSGSADPGGSSSEAARFGQTLSEFKVRNIIYSDFEDENSLLSLSHL